MKWQRIWTVMLRYLYATRDSSRIIEFIFWPVIDIGFFGLIALWGGTLAKDPSLVVIFVTALVLWQIIYRSHFEICVNILDEFMDHNLINLLSSPLKKGEWIAAMMLSGLLKITFTLFFGATVGYLLFGVNVFAIGTALFPLVILCLLSGWVIGFFGAGLVIYKGSKLQQLPWVVIMLAAIFSNVFYPVTVLHPVFRVISLSLPMSYIFEGMRALLTGTLLSTPYWTIGTVLSVIYLTISIKFFLLMFERGRNRGLSRIS